jgi:Spy/CpxP family protein refolding chaperone
MKKGWKAVVAILAVVSAGMVSGCKHGHHGCDPKILKEHVDSKLKAIGATEEQRTKIGGIADHIIADFTEIHKKNKGLKQQFVGCLLLDKPNAEWLHRTVDEKAQELAAFAHRTVDCLIAASGNLTPEQRAELRKRVAKSGSSEL